MFVLRPCDCGCKFSKRYLSQNNFLNLFKLAGCVILSIVKNEELQVMLLCWCVCHMQRSETAETSSANTMPKPLPPIMKMASRSILK